MTPLGKFSNVFHMNRKVLSTMFLLGCVSAYAQNTDIAIGASVLQPAVKRLGINLSFETFYDSGQITKNLVFRNPGFEGEIFQSTIRCATGTANTCVDENIYAGWPAGFWNGATVEFFYGRAQGRKETVAFYAAGRGNIGGSFTFLASGTVPAAGDYMIVRRTIPGNADAGWWPTVSGTAAITTNFTDLPPGTAGRQTIALRAPAATDRATLAAYFDSTAGRSFIALNGTFELSFKAKGIGGSNAIILGLQRSGIEAYLSETVQLSTGWEGYKFTFNASETNGAPGTVALTFNTKGQDSFLLDDVSLTQVDSDPTNPTAFRDEVVNTLENLNPGVLRFWANQLGDTLDNLIAGTYARQRSGFSAFSNLQGDISFGLPEFLQLCETLGTEPWFVIPVTFSTTEAAHLIEYLAGDVKTPYGAKRAAAGHPSTWVSAFSKIHLEFGNEAWNGGFKGGNIEYSAPYGQRAQALFAAMRADKAYLPSAFSLVLGGQGVAAMRNQDIQNNCNNNDAFSIAPYMMNNVDSFANSETLFGSTFAEAEAFHSSTGTAEGVAGGLMLQNQRAIQASNHPVPLVTYEMNLHTVSGNMTQAALNNYASSLGAGLGVINSMLQQMRQGVITQNLFSLQQYKFIRPDGNSVFLWGSVVDMGVTNRRRPQFLAMQMANHAIGGSSSVARDRVRPLAPEDVGKPARSQRVSMLQTAHSGADPVWNQSLANTVQLAGAHYLQTFAFSGSAHRSVVLFNLHRTSSLPVTFSGVNAPVGAIEINQLTSTQVADTNEDASKVGITTQMVDEFNAARPLSLPPFSMTIIRWKPGTGSRSSAPASGTEIVDQ